MSVPLFVGIDTSNYTTSAALCDNDGVVVANIKEPLPVRAGEVGLRQSDALFAHIKNLPAVMGRLREAIGRHTAAAVGVSVTPRDAENSYMPCFLAGRAAAHAFAAAGGIRVFDFSHQSGHIMAAAYSSGALDTLIAAPHCAFHVSGGTTEILHVTPRRGGFDIKKIGGTKDLNAGQAIDRAGTAMGLSFPCGPQLEQLALENKQKIPRPRISVCGLECNLSGLENLAHSLYSSTNDPSLTAAFVLSFVGQTLLELTRNLRAQYPNLPLLYAGGVMGNSIIKSMLAGVGGVYFSEPEFSSDNAAGVALLCRAEYLYGRGENA